MKRAEPLRVLYLSRGYTGHSLARKLDVSPWTLLDWQQGKAAPHLHYFKRLTEVLEVDANTLLEILSHGAAIHNAPMRGLKGKK